MLLFFILIYSLIASASVTFFLIHDGIFSEVNPLWALSFTVAYTLLVLFNTRAQFNTKKVWTIPVLALGSFLSPFIAWIGGIIGFILWGIIGLVTDSIPVITALLSTKLALFMLTGASFTGMLTLIFSSQPFLRQELTIKYVLYLAALSLLLPIVLSFFIDLSSFMSMANVDASVYGMTDMKVLGVFSFVWQFLTLLSFGIFTRTASGQNRPQVSQL
jgi:hypothetical protein